MGFLDSVARGAEFRTLTSGLAQPEGWLTDAIGGGTQSVAGQRVTIQAALGLGPVYSAVSIIAETVGMLPFKVYRELPGEDGEVVTARDHRAWSMLHDQPNPAMPAHRFWSVVTAQLLLWGNSFLRKERGSTGLVESLWLLDPARVMVEWDPDTGEKRYTQQAGYSQPTRRYGNDEVVHVTSLSLNGVVGESVIGRCRNAFGNAMAREKFEGGHWNRGALIQGVLETDRNLGQGAQAEEAVKRVRAGFSVVYGGVDGARTAILEDGMTFRPLSMPLQDMQFVEIAQMSRSEIAMLFKLPASYLNTSSGDSLTYATVEGNQIQFARNAVAPITNVIQKAVSADVAVFPFKSWYGEFVLEGLMRGDSRARADYYKTMSDIKAITVNEVRARENMPPVPWGDDPPVPPHLPTAQAIAEAGDAPPGAPVVIPVANGAGKLPPVPLPPVANGVKP